MAVQGKVLTTLINELINTKKLDGKNPKVLAAMKEYLKTLDDYANA